MAPGVTDVSSERIRVRPVGGLPLIHLDRPRSQDALRWAKRTFDIVGSAALLLARGSPLMIWTAWQIKRHDGGPVLFRQTRVGRDGSYFTCLKFRSMVIERRVDPGRPAPARPATRRACSRCRPTRASPAPGQWIRRYSLDELPQLLNVLRGDMSLVGPRPPLPIEVDRYTLTQSRRLRVRPGTDRPVAGLRPFRPVVERVDPARPLLRRQLVDDPGHRDPDPHRRGRARLARRLLSRARGTSARRGSRRVEQATRLRNEAARASRNRVTVPDALAVVSTSSTDGRLDRRAADRRAARPTALA